MARFSPYQKTFSTNIQFHHAPYIYFSGNKFHLNSCSWQHVLCFERTDSLQADPKAEFTTLRILLQQAFISYDINHTTANLVFPFCSGALMKCLLPRLMKFRRGPLVFNSAWEFWCNRCLHTQSEPVRVVIPKRKRNSASPKKSEKKIQAEGTWGNPARRRFCVLLIWLHEKSFQEHLYKRQFFSSQHLG